MSDQASQSVIAITLCTANRPAFLTACLEGIAKLNRPDGYTLVLCLVENGPSAECFEYVSRFAAECGLNFKYRLEQQMGIPFARNTSIELALETKPDLIACLDDDEVPSQGWLIEHIGALEKFSADVSFCRVTKLYESTPPKWYPIDVEKDSPAGTPLNWAATGNVLFSAKLVNDCGPGLRFQKGLMSGYEDLDFFERASAIGFRIVNCPSAQVWENVPTSRLTSERFLFKIRSAAAAQVQAYRLYHSGLATTWKFWRRALRRMAWGGLLMIRGVVVDRIANDNEYTEYTKSRIIFERGLGALLGMFGIVPKYYAVIDGS
ncbi:glycosyltransferase family 2 protein [Roseibium sp.]|uniref:glycosyltransferase family 2 protein n=1 Tax=Roseibium sp. TaxID=1936156 RepID=UPI003A978840